MCPNVNDIVSGVYARLGTANIPSEITSGNIADMANDRVESLNNFTGLTISGDDIPRQFTTPLKDFVTADVIARTLGIDIDVEIGVGNIRLGYRDIYTAENRQLEYFLTKAENSLNMLGRRIEHATTTKVS